MSIRARFVPAARLGLFLARSKATVNGALVVAERLTPFVPSIPLPDRDPGLPEGLPYCLAVHTHVLPYLGQ